MVPWAAGQLIGAFSSSSKMTRGPPPPMVTRDSELGAHAAIVTLSTGPLGGVAANHDVRRSLVTLNAATMAHPEMYLSQVNKLFEGADGAGPLNPGTREFLGKFLAAFDTWARRFAAV